MPVFDCHCHSEHSHDSNTPVRMYADNGIALGLSGLTVTDHFDPLVPAHPHRPQEVDWVRESVDEVCSLKEEYDGRIKLLCGVEMGDPFLFMDDSHRILADKRLDVVIASVHDFYVTYDDSRRVGYNPIADGGKSAHRIIEAYFADIYRNAAFMDADILGHITYLMRYIMAPGADKVDIKQFAGCCEDIMQVAIRRHLAIEINCKTLTLGGHPDFNELDFFKRYRALGGELVTIGSDAHTADGQNTLPKAAELLKAAGFKHACYYEKRQPIFYDL